MSRFQQVNWIQVEAGFGQEPDLRGILQDSPDQVGPAILRALEATNNNQPAVLEMMTKEEETIARYWR